jgi:hypothetical protein
MPAWYQTQPAPTKSRQAERLDALKAENKTLRAKLGKPEPKPDGVRRTEAQMLHMAVQENNALKSAIPAPTPPPPPKQKSELVKLAEKFRGKTPTGDELDGLCKTLLSAMKA